MIEQLQKLKFWIYKRQATYNDHIEMSTIVSKAIQMFQTQNQKIETLEKKVEALEAKIEILEDE